MPAGRRRVAMCGTFDVRNLGDMLFPLVLQMELGGRVPQLDAVYFSYSAQTPPDWPYPVQPMASLPGRIQEFDAVVIGGGHLIRFDKDVAPGYFPPDPGLHHPTSYRLLPAMLGAAAGVPVIWSAVGASAQLPEWGRELLAGVLPASAYISVRDAVSLAELQPLSGRRPIQIVPDTVFGIPAVLPPPARPAERYVVIQATAHLQPYSEPLGQLLQWFHQEGLKVIQLPIAPVLGDGEIPEFSAENAAFREWADPLEAVGLIANAAAVVGLSLHLSIIALAYGVPVIRPFQNALDKYQAIHELENVFPLESYAAQSGRINAAIRQPRCAGAEIEACQNDLRQHWDRVAAILAAPAQSVKPALAPLLQKLPFLLEAREETPENDTVPRGLLQSLLAKFDR